MFKRNNNSEHIVRVCETITYKNFLVLFIFGILTGGLGFIFLDAIYKNYKDQQKIISLGKREQWLYQASLDRGLTGLDYKKGVAWNSGRICALWMDLPKELRNADDFLKFKIT